jgi:hypothetical protein
MPNWCVSELVITGPQQERDKIFKILESDEKAPGFLGKTVAEDVQNNENSLVYLFKSRWSPVEEKEVFDFFKEYPELKFALYYAERGMNFYGQYGNHIPCFKGEFRTWDFLEKKGLTEEEREEEEDELVSEMKRFQSAYNLSG